MPSTAEIVNLPMESIAAGPNVRDKYDVEELAASIEAIGLIHPIIVRRISDEENEFSICAGHRRFAAFELLKNENIPSMILEDCDEQQALKIMQTENLQREDLTPLEEAKMIGQLMEAGASITEISRIQGKTREWVGLRRRLTNLSEKWQKAMTKEDMACSRWPVTHLAMVALLEKEVQDEHEFWMSRNFSTKALQTTVADLTRLLKKAPWDTEDAALVAAAGSCTACPSRSSRVPGLFEEDDESEVTIDDKCLNDHCWHAKRLAHVELAYAELIEKEPHAVMVKAPQSHYEKAPKGALEQWDYHKCKKADNGSRPALLVSGPRAGKRIYVTVMGSAEKKVDRPLDPETGKPKPKLKPMKERRADLKRRRFKLAIQKASGMLELFGTEYDEAEDNGLPTPPEIPSIEAVFAMAAAFGTSTSASYVEWWTEANGTHVSEPAKAVLEMTAVEQHPILWHNITPVLLGRWRYKGADQDLGAVWDDVERVYTHCGAESAGFLEDAVIEIKEPKSWEKLNEDGSPKVRVVKPKAKPKKKAAKPMLDENGKALEE